jgi:hypothetical protein
MVGRLRRQSSTIDVFELGKRRAIAPLSSSEYGNHAISIGNGRPPHSLAAYEAVREAFIAALDNTTTSFPARPRLDA